MTVYIKIENLKFAATSPILAEIVEGIKNGFQKGGQFIDVVDDINCVAIESKRVLSMWGIGGHSYAEEEIFQINIDSDNPHLNEPELRERVSRTTSHELYHYVRDRHFMDSSDNLMRALVDEGLAQHFEIETGHSAPVGPLLSGERCL